LTYVAIGRHKKGDVLLNYHLIVLLYIFCFGVRIIFA